MLNLKKKKIIILNISIIFLLLIVGQSRAAVLNKSKVKKKIKSAFANRQETIKIRLDRNQNDFNLNKIKNVFREAQEESNAYFRYTINSWRIKARGNNRRIRIIIDVNYLSSSTQDEYVFRRVSEIISKIEKQRLNIHEQVKAINDYLIKQIEYDHTLISETPYQALKKGRTTCRGYALLTHLLLQEIGIESKVVTGNLRGQSDPHAWNLIQMDGNWYHLDVTQNAGHYRNQSELAYGWYNLSDKAISSTHIWNTAEYPKAKTSYLKELLSEKERNPKQASIYQQLIMDLNLHYLQDEYTVRNKKDLNKKLRKALTEKRKEISFRTSKKFFSGPLIKNMLKSIYRKNRTPAVIRGFNLRQINYNRDLFRNTIIMTINFNYK